MYINKIIEDLNWRAIESYLPQEHRKEVMEKAM